jgi:hypothetical protein
LDQTKLRRRPIYEFYSVMKIIAAGAAIFSGLGIDDSA